MVTEWELITSHVTFLCHHSTHLPVLQLCVTIGHSMFIKHKETHMPTKTTPQRNNGRTKRSRKPCLKSLLRFAVTRAIPQIIFLVIGLITGLSIGLVGGFLIAWTLCLRLLSILVLIPLGPGGW